MAKRKRAPTQEEMWAAIEAARKGKGRALAAMIKSFSVEDLAKGFSRCPYPEADCFDAYQAIASALSYASGSKQGRDEFNTMMREADKKARREMKAAEAQP